MIRLLIDGQDVVLPLDMKIDYFRENPFFSRNGEYTYDIDIDLNCEQNRKLYSSIDRPDVSKRITGRQAVLMDGYHVLAKGTEVVLSVEDKTAKIQVVAGNSELNYLTGGDRRIRQMDLGDFSISKEQAYASLSGCYPDYNYCCPPIFLSYENEEEYEYDNRMDIVKGSTTYQGDTYISPQPYVLYVFDQVIQNLGYTIVENVLLEEERWCRLFLVNGYHTTKVAEMLPDWSVDEFLDEMEKFFNCTLIVNSDEKTVRILRTDTFYSNKEKVFVDQVLDEGCKKNYDVNENLRISYKNVRYDFPNYNWYKYQCLTDEARNVCQVIDIANHFEYMNFCKVNSYTMYHSLDYNLFFGGNQMVDRFAPIEDGTKEDEVALKVIPAETVYYLTGAANETFFRGGFTAVYARNRNTKDTTDNSGGFTELVTEGLPQADVPANLYVAIFMGWQGLFVDSTEAAYQHADYRLPMSAVDQFVYDGYWYCCKRYPNEKAHLTLRLQGDNGLYNQFYKNNVKVNTQTEYTFRFLSDTLLDTRCIFVIKNKEFYCKELHHTISTEKICKEVEGIFYLVEE